MKLKLALLIGFISTSMFSQVDTISNLNEVRIDGVRANKNMPVTQITLTRDSIQRFHQGFEATQLLDDTPSITSSSDGGHPFGYTSFRIRGIDQTRINMTLNGVPMNEPEDQGAYFSNYPNFLDVISSMQIQRGVGTSSNGVSSYGGSINFIGNTGEERMGDIKLTMGSFNTRLVNFGFGSGISSNKLSFFMNISSYESDGYRYNSSGLGSSAFIGAGYHGDKDVFRLTLFTGNSINGMAWLPVLESDIKNDPKTNYNENDAKDNFTQTFVQLEYNRFFTNNSKFTTTGFYTNLVGQYDYYMVGKNYFFLRSNLFGLNNNFNKKFKNSEINVGVNGTTYVRHHESTFINDLFKNKGNKDELNTYFKIIHNIGSLKIFGDIQYRFINFTYNGNAYMPVQQWNFINPKVGSKLKITNHSEIYGLVGKSHREPTRSNLFGGSSNFIALSNIVSEEVIDYELGYNLKKSNVEVNFNLYYMDFKNEISTNGEYGDNSLLLYYNLPSSYRSGLEFNLIYKPNNNITITYNDNISKNGIKGSELEQLYSPKTIKNLSVSYDYKGFKATISGKYHSASFIDVDNNFETPSFIIFNANMGYTYKVYSIYLSLINFTNQRYYTNGNSDSDGNRYFFANAPLNYSLTFKLKL